MLPVSMGTTMSAVKAKKKRILPNPPLRNLTLSKKTAVPLTQNIPGSVRKINGKTRAGMSSPSPLNTCMRTAATARIPVTTASTAKLLSNFPSM